MIRIAPLASVLLTLVTVSSAQVLTGRPSISRAKSAGTFVNLETPQVKPITVARVGSTDVLVVCNTPDASIEIYEAESPYSYLQRVPVGLGPVTVRWDPGIGRLLVCNFDGDSVSVVRLDPGPGTPPVVATLERTSIVGDEPSDITTGNPVSAVVTLSGRSAATIVHPITLAVQAPEFVPVAPNPFDAIPMAIKAPRQVEQLADGRVVALNHMGDTAQPTSAPDRRYDLDVFIHDPGATPVEQVVAGLGTTNHAFAASRDATKLYVVGTLARHLDAVGVTALSQLPTGFVESRLWVVDIPAGSSPSVAPEAPPLTVPAPTLQSLDLNRDYTRIQPTPVPPAHALSQPTAIVLIEDDQAPFALEKAVITAFHSDAIAFLEPDASVAGGWAIRRVSIPVLDRRAGYGMSGPRGLAYSPDATDPATPLTPGLVYVLDRLDNTVAVVNPHTESVIAHFPLACDPTPRVVREGREFLYGAHHSGSGIVACASCHVDARTDGLPWDLGGSLAGPPVPPWFHDGNNFDTASMPVFPAEKGPMVTQTLQGLVNHLVNPESQAMFTNAPYHWRGDKSSFTDFNEAFVNLMGAANVGGAADPKGVTDLEMKKYEAFVDTVAHPPNPQQPFDRTLPGALGSDPNDPLQASGAKLGIMVFHDFATVDVRSCVNCHQLPDGSSNTSTLAFDVPKTLSGGGVQMHPFESAALRNLVQREMRVHSDFTVAPTAVSASFGLLHPGDPGFLTSFSINTFISGTFFSVMPGPGSLDRLAQVQAVVEFVRSLDWGIAPAAGVAYTLDPAVPGADTAVLDLLEGQVLEANIGLAVRVIDAGAQRGLWFDASVTPPVYRDTAAPAALTRAQLQAIAAVAGNAVILQGTPLGSDRRLASAAGAAARISDPAHPPANVTLEPMAPIATFEDVTKFDTNIPAAPSPQTSAWTLLTLQASVAGGPWGVPANVRHEPPRRFRVTGDDIRPGARLLLGMAMGTAPAALPVQEIELDLYPTGRTLGGRRIWESEEQLDATLTMALLNGGPGAPGVLDTLWRTTSTPALDPANWNALLVTVVNEDGTRSPSTWQPLSVQDGR